MLTDWICAALFMDDTQTCIKFIKLSIEVCRVNEYRQRDVHTAKGIRRYTSTLCTADIFTIHSCGIIFKNIYLDLTTYFYMHLLIFNFAFELGVALLLYAFAYF